MTSPFIDTYSYAYNLNVNCFFKRFRIMVIGMNDPVNLLDLSAGEVKFYNQHGFLLIPGLLSDSTAAVLHAEVMHIMNQIGLAMDKLKQTGEHLSGSCLETLIHSERLRGVASQLVGGPASLYLPFTAVKGSGGGRFHFHQDNQYTQLDGPALNLWMALSPMTPENGCLQVVPGSHLQGTFKPKESGDGDRHLKVPFEPTDFFPLRMRAGDCVAFTRLTIHGSGPNSTPDPRVAYGIQFHRDDVNWLEKQSGQWKSVKQFPPFKTASVNKITVPTGKVDGH